MKKLIVLFTFILLTNITMAASNVDTGSGSNANFKDVLELELSKGQQNPRTLEFEYILRIKSLIETDRVRVNWDLANGLLSPADGISLSDQVLLKKGEEIFIAKRFIPLEPGYEEIRVNATAFGPSAVYDYFSFTHAKFFVNTKLLVSPDSTDYKVATNLSNILNILKGFLSIMLVILTSLIIYYKFKFWLDNGA